MLYLVFYHVLSRVTCTITKQKIWISEGAPDRMDERWRIEHLDNGFLRMSTDYGRVDRGGDSMKVKRKDKVVKIVESAQSIINH